MNFWTYLQKTQRRRVLRSNQRAPRVSWGRWIRWRNFRTLSSSLGPSAGPFSENLLKFDFGKCGNFRGSGPIHFGPFGPMSSNSLTFRGSGYLTLYIYTYFRALSRKGHIQILRLRVFILIGIWLFFLKNSDLGFWKCVIIWLFFWKIPGTNGYTEPGAVSVTVIFLKNVTVTVTAIFVFGNRNRNRNFIFR